MSRKWKQLASVALGGDVKLDDTWSAHVWIAAIRSRDPWIDLSKMIKAEEQTSLPAVFWELPDVVIPSEYQWRVKPVSKAASFHGLVSASPSKAVQVADQETESQLAMMMTQSTNPATVQEDFDELVKSIENRQQLQLKSGGFFAAQLHRLRVYPAPAYSYPYLATQWPLKLDWYWCLATIALTRRLESGSSVEERYSQFFLPLLESYRPLCPMAARALWIASISKDTNARSMAVEVWIALMADDRCDLYTLINALAEVVQGGWVKFNRISELMAEVARVSPQHAYLVASVLDDLLCRIDVPANDVAKLIEPLNECCVQLGRSISDSLKQSLAQIKSGKGRAIAKALCERSHLSTEHGQSAITSALSARIDRALSCS
jgi:hypothetical protein